MEYYNLEEEKSSVYQVGDTLVSEEQMQERYPFYAELYEELKSEFLQSSESQNPVSVREWVDRQVQEGKMDSSLVPMLEYELGSEFGTSTSNISFRGMCKCLYEWKHGEVNLQLKHTS